MGVGRRRQSLGHVGGPLRPTGLPSTAGRSYGTTDVGQFLSGFVHTKTGGTVYVPSHSRGTVPGAGRTYHSSGQTHSRRSECSGRPAVQNEQNSAHGMDPSPVSVQGTMGHTQSGPVCNPPQQQASGVCVPLGRPTSCGCRCHVDVMEGNVCLCIPPICDAGASTGESAQGSFLRDDSSRPEMAQSVLVHQTVGTTSRFSFGPATEERSAVPAPQPPETRVTPSGVPTRLEAVKRSLTERGFCRQLPIRSQAVVGNPPERSMTANGRSSLWLVCWASGGSFPGYYSATSGFLCISLSS